jgi:mannosyltransferase
MKPDAPARLPQHAKSLRCFPVQAGASEFMLRLPSALFATATVPLIYALGAELDDRRAGLVAALLIATNATFIEWGQTARSYALFVALATLASVLFVRGIKRGSAACLAGYIASGTASVYAHLFGIFAVPSQWLSLFLFRPPRKRIIRLSLCMLAIGVLAVPAFYYAISGDAGNEAWVPKTSFEVLAKMFPIYAGAFRGRQTILTTLLLVLYLIGMILAIVRTPRSKWFAPGYLLVSILLPMVLAFAVSVVKPIFVDRYLLTGVPLFALVAAMGFVRLRPRLANTTVIVLLILSLMQSFSYYNSPSIQDWRGVVDFIATNSQPGDSLAVYPSYYTDPIDYYVSHGSAKTFPTIVYPAPTGPWEDAVSRKRFLSSFEDLDHRIWLTFPTVAPPRYTEVRMISETDLTLILGKTRIVEEPRFAGVRLLLLEGKH